MAAGVFEERYEDNVTSSDQPAIQGVALNDRKDPESFQPVLQKHDDFPPLFADLVDRNVHQAVVFLHYFVNLKHAVSRYLAKAG